MQTLLTEPSKWSNECK